MDYRDHMDDRTYRLLEQARQQVVGGMIPKLNQPTFDVAKLTTPTLSVMDQLNRQAGEIAGTAIQGNTRLQEQIDRQATKFADAALQRFGHMGPSVSEQIAAAGTSVFDTQFGTGLGVIGQAHEALNLINQPLSISEALYGVKGFSSLLDTIGPSISQMSATAANTSAWKGLGATPAYSVYEKWRLANVGALTKIDGVLGSLDNYPGITQALPPSAFARTLFASAGALRDVNIEALSGIDLSSEYATLVDQLLADNEDVAAVATELEQDLVDRFNISQKMAHEVIRVLIWITTTAIMIGITKGIPVLGEVLGTILEVTEIFSAKKFAKHAAQKVIPLPERTEE